MKTILSDEALLRRTTRSQPINRSVDAIRLPDDIFSDKSELKNPIIIYPYVSRTSRFKEKSVLHRNAISLVIRGRKTIRFAEKAVDTNDREIHFLSVGNNIASFDISKQKEFESILIFFTDEELRDFSVAHAKLIEKLRRGQVAKPERYISFAKDEFIRNFIQSMRLLARRRLSEAMKRHKLWELLLYLLENRTQPFVSFLYRGQAPQQEVTIRSVVEGRVTDNLTLDEMAFLCNMSASTFKRQFNRIYGAPPAQWLLDQKMKLAARMLTERKQRPAEIWAKLGFETHAGFTKSFKKHFGMSPKSYAL